jgi:hypothetical protein
MNKKMIGCTASFAMTSHNCFVWQPQPIFIGALGSNELFPKLGDLAAVLPVPSGQKAPPRTLQT